jgi:hypothetical protein
MPEMTKPLLDPDKIIKEVFSTEEIKPRTELNAVQVEAVNKLSTLASLFGSDLLRLHLDDFMTLQKSKDRKSMAEFVESLRSKKEDLVNKAKSFALFG